MTTKFFQKILPPSFSTQFDHLVSSTKFFHIICLTISSYIFFFNPHLPPNYTTKCFQTIFHRKPILKMFNKNFTSFTIHFTHKFSSQFFHPVFTPFFCTFSTLFTKSALGPLWSSSRNVRIIIYLSVPSQRVFFQASYWPSDHMISSRRLIGNPPPFFLSFLNLPNI